MSSEYLIAVIDKSTGKVTHSWEPGFRVEKNFEDELVQRVKAKGVGIARTEKHVLADLRAALKELLHDLKLEV